MGAEARQYPLSSHRCFVVRKIWQAREKVERRSGGTKPLCKKRRGGPRSLEFDKKPSPATHLSCTWNFFFLASSFGDTYRCTKVTSSHGSQWDFLCQMWNRHHVELPIEVGESCRRGVSRPSCFEDRWLLACSMVQAAYRILRSA